MESKDWVSVVRSTAVSLSLIDGNGKLKQLDSLTIIDLVVELEDATNLQIPPELVRIDKLASVDMIAELLRGLAERVEHA